MTARSEFLTFKTNIDLSGLQRANSLMDSLVSKADRVPNIFNKMRQASRAFGNEFESIGSQADKSFTSAGNSSERMASQMGRSNEKTSQSVKGLNRSYSEYDEQLQKSGQETTKFGGLSTTEMQKMASRSSDSLNKVATTAVNSEKKSTAAVNGMTHGTVNGFNKGSTSARTYSKSVNALTSVHDKLLSGARSAGIGILGVGAAFVSGAKKAIDLQNSYKETTNLIVNGGEKQSEAIKNVSKMQSDGAKFSQKYGKSQKEISSGYQELVKRGYSSTQALGAMKSMLQASVASGDGFSDVVTNSTAALESFGMRAKTTAGMIKNTKIATNEMAYASDLTATDFKSMGEAMTYVGATAHQAHLSLSETSSAIGALSNSGLEGTVAGTGLRKVLNSLISPTKGGADALKQMGLTTKDLTTNGHLKSLSSIFTTLNKQTKGMSSVKQGQLFKALFGATGQAAATVLTQSASSLGKLNKQVENSVKTNYIGKLADKNMSSAKNQLAIFKQTFNNMQTVFAAKLLPYVTKAAKALTTIIGKFSELPKSTQGWLVGITLATTALGATAFVVGGILGKITAIKTFFGQWKSNSKPDSGQDIINKQNGELSEQIGLLKETNALKDANSGSVETASVGSRAGTTHYAPSAFSTRVSTAKSGIASKASSVKSAILNSTPISWITGIGGKAKNAGTKVVTNTKNVGAAVTGKEISSNSGLLTRGISKVTSSKLTRAVPVVGSALMAGSSLLSAKPGKMGSSVGSAAGSVAGGVAGDLLGPIGGMLGSVAGGAVGGAAGGLFDSKKGGTSALTKIKKDAKKLSVGVKDAMALITKPIGSKRSNAAQVSINKTFGKMTPTIEKAVFGIRGALGKLGSGFKTVMKPMKSFGSWLSKTFGKTFKSLSKTVSPVFKDIGNAMSSMGRTFNNAIHKYFGGKSSGVSKSIANTLKAMISFAKPVIKLVSKTLVGGFKVIAAGVRVVIDLIKNIFNSSIGSWVKIFKGGLKIITGTFKLFGDVLTGNWKNIGKDIGKIASGIWDAISGIFEAGINGVIGVINTGLDGINGLISKLPKKIRPSWHLHISPVHFANGTGTLPLTRQNGQKPHAGGPMVVNDATSGPHHELVILPNGKSFIPRGKNVMFNAPRGTEVINGMQTKQLLGAGYANGTTSVATKTSSLKSATDATKSLSKFSAKSKSIWNKNNSDTQKAVSKNSKVTTSGYKTATSKLAKTMTSWQKTNKSDLSATSKDTTTYTNKIYKTAVDKYSDLKSNLAKTSNSINKQWRSDWSDMAQFFNKEFGKLDGYAHHGMAGAISELNGGIKGIDVVVGKFGGNSAILPTIHYAKGSNGPIANNQMAVLNDATSGPRQEAVINPRGQVMFPKGRNTVMPLEKGSEVLNGTEVQQFSDMGLLPHYATGTGVTKRLRSQAKSNLKNPTGAFTSEFDDNIGDKGLAGIGESMKAVGKGAIDSVGPKWSAALWQVINNAMDDTDGSSSDFLNYAIKSSKGKKYVWGAKGPITFDCSGLVQYAAAHEGVSLSAPSGSQYAATKSISESSAQPGDLVFFGPNGGSHVGIYAGPNKMWSAMNPNSSPNIGYSVIHGFGESIAGFHRIPGMKNTTKKKDKNSGLTSLVKSELGSKAISWITKNLGDALTMANPAGDGTGRWIKVIKQAAQDSHVSLSAGGLSAILKRIAQESGGNASVTNNWDSNAAAGTPSKGLLQYIQPTLSSWVPKGVKANLSSGYSQLMAMFNDSNWLRDISVSGGWGPTGHKRRAKGGQVTPGETYLVGEQGPELYTPEQTGDISSYQKTKKLFGGQPKSGNTTINFNPKISININATGDTSDIKSQVKQGVSDALDQAFEKLQLVINGDGDVVI